MNVIDGLYFLMTGKNLDHMKNDKRKIQELIREELLKKEEEKAFRKLNRNNSYYNNVKIEGFPEKLEKNKSINFEIQIEKK